MARIRTIKPEFWQHPKTAAVSRDARLLFLGLLNEADDEGRMRYSPKRLAGVLFPFDDDVTPALLDRWIGELEFAGLVQRYEVDGGSYLAVCGFSEHQRINRKTDSTLPEPPPHALTEAAVMPPHALTEVVHREVEVEVEQGGGSVTQPSRVSAHDPNDPAEPIPPNEVEQRIREHRWAARVTPDEVNEALFVLRSERIPAEILLEALTSSDPFPSKWKTRARQLHTERQPPPPAPRPDCPTCYRSGFVLNDLELAVPCPDCTPAEVSA